jgi:hypothetical protein
MLDSVGGYYQGVMELLRHVELRSASKRRFGGEADAQQTG